jgi:hypothetical protein
MRRTFEDELRQQISDLEMVAREDRQACIRKLTEESIGEMDTTVMELKRALAKEELAALEDLEMTFEKDKATLIRDIKDAAVAQKETKLKELTHELKGQKDQLKAAMEEAAQRELQSAFEVLEADSREYISREKVKYEQEWKRRLQHEGSQLKERARLKHETDLQDLKASFEQEHAKALQALDEALQREHRQHIDDLTTSCLKEQEEALNYQRDVMRSRHQVRKKQREFRSLPYAMIFGYSWKLGGGGGGGKNKKKKR